MELNLIYGGTKCVFDIHSNIVLSYIKELCTKIFPLKPKTFELFYNNENLKSYDDNTQLKEIIDNDDDKLSIYVKSLIPKKEKEENIILLPKDRNLNCIKLKFDNFNKDYLKITNDLKDFKNNYQEKINTIKDLIKEFEINTIKIDDRLGNYFNIKNYNKCLEIFNENVENLNENDLINLNNLIEKCIKDFKIIETQSKYENKIINYLNDFINQFQKIKKCSDNIQHMNDFKKTLTELDLLYSILFSSINKKVKNLSYNGNSKLFLNLKSENSVELPIIEKNDLNKTKFYTLENENNLFKNYQNNVDLIKKNKNHNLSNNFERKTEIFPLSPKTQSIFNQSSISRNKSKLKIRGLTKKLKLHLKKFFDNENSDNNNITNNFNEEDNKNNNKKYDNNSNNDEDNSNKNDYKLPNVKNKNDNNNKEEKKEKFLNEESLNLKSQKSKNTINLNNNNINNIEEEKYKKRKSQSLFLNRNKIYNFKPNLSIEVDEKKNQELREQLNKTLSTNKKKIRIESQIKENGISKDEIITDDEIIQNHLLKKEIDLLKSEIEKLKSYNNILKNDIENIKNNQIPNKNLELRNNEKKSTEKKNTNILNDSFNKKSESSNFLTFNSRKLKSQIISKEISKEENKYNDSNEKKNYQRKYTNSQILDLSSKLIEITPTSKNKKEEEEIILTPNVEKKINKNLQIDDFNFYDENNNPDLIYNGLQTKKTQNNNDKNNINYLYENDKFNNQLFNYNKQSDIKIENKKHKKKKNKFDFII